MSGDLERESGRAAHEPLAADLEVDGGRAPREGGVARVSQLGMLVGLVVYAAVVAFLWARLGPVLWAESALAITAASVIGVLIGRELLRPRP